jgi:hypothetical protein
MIVESEVPFSASWVIAQCRRSWNRNPGRPAFFVKVLHACHGQAIQKFGSDIDEETPVMREALL